MILPLAVVMMLPLINGQFHTDRVNAVIHENGILLRSSNITFFHQIGRHKTGNIISIAFFFWVNLCHFKCYFLITYLQEYIRFDLEIC